MKTNWQTRKLGEILKIQNGYAFDSAGFTNNGGTPLIRIRDLKGGTDTEINYGGNYDSRYIVSRGDFLIGMDGEFRCYEWKGSKALLNQRVCRLHDFKGLNSRFLFYGINKYLKDIEDSTSYTTVKHISSRQIENIYFSYPIQESEQERIVKILDEAFEKLERIKENTEKNLQNFKRLFESYLNDIFSNPRKDWEQRTLEEVSSDFGRGKSKHRPRNDKRLYGGIYPFIQTGDIRNSSHFITEYTQTYNEIGLAQSKLWPKGTICITIAANIAETGILTFDACFPDSVIGIVVDPNKAESGFVEYLLQFFKTLIQSKGKGSAQANINMGTFENQKFPFPSVLEQRKLIQKLDQLSEQTKKLETLYKRKLECIEELKKSILNKAFSGEI